MHKKRLKRYFGHIEQVEDVNNGPLNDLAIARTQESPISGEGVSEDTTVSEDKNN